MNMRHSLIAISLTALVVFTACKDTDVSYMPSIEQMKDSVFHQYANITGITIEVKEAEVLSITVLDPKLYNGTDEQRHQTANELGAMALRIFPKDNTLAKGELLVAKDQNSMTSDDRKRSPIDIQAMRQANTPQ